MGNNPSITSSGRNFYNTSKYIYAFAFIGFLIFVIYNHITDERKNVRYNISGIAEKVKYDDKGDVAVIVKGKLYTLKSTTWDLHHLIKKGDSIRKDSGKLVLKLIKHENGKVIIVDGKY